MQLKSGDGAKPVGGKLSLQPSAKIFLGLNGDYALGRIAPIAVMETPCGLRLYFEMG
ncbi:hypothetical protein [Rhizobium laguerreae]|uniref:hypothetical protein n=1 Tax=Rhizobium laguerreae TaxID=1076926 RepID=UPI001C927706|nr:hypothetical protein [Rhizobium laguerreae]MBY3321166.1 hypothetical protein [Rhizobium laguerreae]